MLRSRDFFVMPGYLLLTAFSAELVFEESTDSAASRKSVTTARTGALPARAVRQHTERADLLELQERLRSASMGPCLSTGCIASFHYQRPYVDVKANELLGQLFLEHAQQTGDSARLLAGASAQPQQHYTMSSSLGAVSHSVPTMCPLFTLDAEPSLMGAAACCTDDAFDRCLQARRCLALTALALLRDPALVHKREEDHGGRSPNLIREGDTEDDDGRSPLNASERPSTPAFPSVSPPKNWKWRCSGRSHCEAVLPDESAGNDGSGGAATALVHRMPSRLNSTFQFLYFRAGVAASNERKELLVDNKVTQSCRYRYARVDHKQRYLWQ
ncbi:hypothetical protein MRX96_039910 [Rhipicephalus microplus]